MKLRGQAVAVKNIVAEYQSHAVLADKILSDQKRFRESSRLELRRI